MVALSLIPPPRRPLRLKSHLHTSGTGFPNTELFKLNPERKTTPGQKCQAKAGGNLKKRVTSALYMVRRETEYCHAGSQTPYTKDQQTPQTQTSLNPQTPARTSHPRYLRLIPVPDTRRSLLSIAPRYRHPRNPHTPAIPNTRPRPPPRGDVRPSRYWPPIPRGPARPDSTPCPPPALP